MRPLPKFVATSAVIGSLLPGGCAIDECDAPFHNDLLCERFGQPSRATIQAARSPDPWSGVPALAGRASVSLPTVDGGGFGGYVQMDKFGWVVAPAGVPVEVRTRNPPHLPYPAFEVDASCGRIIETSEGDLIFVGPTASSHVEMAALGTRDPGLSCR